MNIEDPAKLDPPIEILVSVRFEGEAEDRVLKHLCDFYGLATEPFPPAALVAAQRMALSCFTLRIHATRIGSDGRPVFTLRIRATRIGSDGHPVFEPLPFG